MLNDDAAGASHSFGLFGEVPASVPVAAANSPVMYGFAGREFEPESGLYYNRARMYSSIAGRFLSQDPIGYVSGDPNYYRANANNPLLNTDPTGLFTLVGGVGGSGTAGTGGEVSGGGYVNPGLFGQKGEFGVVGSVGASAGVNVSADAYAGVIFGGAEHVSGTTVNTNFSIGPLSYTGMYDAQTGAFTGFTIGLGPSATFISASTSISSTGRFDVLQYLMMGEPNQGKAAPCP